MKQFLLIAVIMLLGLVYTAGTDPPKLDQQNAEVSPDDNSFYKEICPEIATEFTENLPIQMEAERPVDTVIFLQTVKVISDMQDMTINNTSTQKENVKYQAKILLQDFNQKPGMA